MADDPAGESATLLSVGTDLQFELSPYLYMQFVEPLGTTDSSVDAAWDFTTDRWTAMDQLYPRVGPCPCLSHAWPVYRYPVRFIRQFACRPGT